MQQIHLYTISKIFINRFWRVIVFKSYYVLLFLNTQEKKSEKIRARVEFVLLFTTISLLKCFIAIMLRELISILILKPEDWHVLHYSSLTVPFALSKICDYLKLEMQRFSRIIKLTLSIGKI